MIARVYQAINAVGAALAQHGVAKTRLNAQDNYLYRSIDDVLERLAPLLAQHKLCILPRVLAREAAERTGEDGEMLASVTLRVAFDLVSAEDGSCHTIEAYGEALDAGDKATPKAMQSAYKYAVLQAFCIPALQAEDADARGYRLKQVAPFAQPAEGWQRWCEDLVEATHASTDLAGLEALKVEARPLLAALQRENPRLYRQVGEAFAARSRALGEDGASTARERAHGTTAVARMAQDAATTGDYLAQSAPSTASGEQLAQPAPTPLAVGGKLGHAAPNAAKRPSSTSKRRKVSPPPVSASPERSNGSGMHG